MVIWHGPFNDLSGYAEAARGYITALYNAGVDIRTIFQSYDIRGGNSRFLDQEALALCRHLEVDRSDLIDRATYVSHATPNILYTSLKSKKKVAYSVWETNRVPESFENSLRQFDFILTPSEFSKRSFQTTFPDLDVRVVGHIIKNYVNAKIKKTDGSFEEMIRNRTRDKFVFMYNGEYHIGKGYDVLLKGFCKAFENNEDVFLIYKTYLCNGVNYRDDVISYIKEVKAGRPYPRIFPIVGDLNYNDLLRLYRFADVFINTSRREGWSLTSSEAFGFRKRIIAPDKGGHTEFLNDHNAYLFESSWEDVKDLEFNRSLYLGQKWIEPNLDAFITVLVAAYDQLRDATKEEKMIPEEYWRPTLERFSEETVVGQLAQYLI